MSSVLNPENISSNKSFFKIDNEVFLSKSIFSFFSLQTDITFPRTLKCPPRISDILSFARYCSCTDNTAVPISFDKIKSIVPLF